MVLTRLADHRTNTLMRILLVPLAHGRMPDSITDVLQEALHVQRGRRVDSFHG